MSCNDETWYSYTLPKEDPKNTWIKCWDLTYEIKIEDVSEYFSSTKDMFDFSSYLIKSKYYDNLNSLTTSPLVRI